MTSKAVLVRGFVPLDAARVNAVAQEAFRQYAQDYEDWPSFNQGRAVWARCAGG